MTTDLEKDQRLPPYLVTAFNYATDSENKIHHDAVARDLGFSGGLVPGVGDYAYLTRPVLDALGEPWLERGRLAARFLKPIYDGDRVEAVGRVHSADPPLLELELRDSRGTVCASAEASLLEGPQTVAAGAYPRAFLPAPSERPPASLEVLAAGTVLGTLHLDGEETRALRRDAAARFCDAHPLFAADDGPLHPALLPDLANRILSRNVLLGPWIHTASEVRHAGLRLEPQGLTQGLEVRARVAEAFPRRGHETVVLDVALFAGDDDRLIGTVRHVAIVRPRQLAGR